MMRRCSLVLCLTAAAWMLAEQPVSAQWNFRMRRSVALCPECVDLAAEVNALTRQIDETSKRRAEIQREDERLAGELSTTDEAFREATGRGQQEVAARLRQQLTAIIERRAALSKESEQLYSRYDALLRELPGKQDQLEACNRTCLTRTGGTPSGDLTTTGGDKPTGDAGTPTVELRPDERAKCAACQPAENALRDAKMAFEAVLQRLGAARARFRDIENAIETLQNERAALQARADASSGEVQDRIRKIDESWRQQGAQAMAADDEFAAALRESDELIRRIQALRFDLEACNRDKCPRTSDGGTGTGTAGGTPSTSGGCADCAGLQERISALEAEIKEIAETIDNIQENQQQLETARERASNDAQRQNIDGQQAQLKAAHAKAVAQEKQKTTELEGLNGRLKGCGTCGTSSTNTNLKANTTGNAPTTTGTPPKTEPPPPLPPPNPPAETPKPTSVSGGPFVPIDGDCMVPSTCSLPAGPGMPPAVNLLSAPTAFNTSASADVETRIQIKLGDLLNPADHPAIAKPFPAGGAPGDTVIEIVIEAVPPAQVRSWFDPLGLLARRLTDHIARWRGRMGPRPLINPRDLIAVERYSTGQTIGLPKGVHVLLTDRGGSTGKTLGMQVLNLTGQPVRLASMPFAIEPIKQQAQQRVQQAFTRLAKAAPVNLDLAAYCVEFLKLPPAANQIFRLAPAAVQKKYESMSRVLRSAYRVQQAGLLQPDSDREAYADSIKQWAMWTVEQKFNESRFTAAFIGHTKKNVEAAGQPWPTQAEEMIRKVSPNRWRDIASILRGAGLPVPQ